MKNFLIFEQISVNIYNIYGVGKSSLTFINLVGPHNLVELHDGRLKLFLLASFLSSIDKNGIIFQKCIFQDSTFN